LRDHRRILVLEDEPIVGFALEDMLEALGYDQIWLATRLDEAAKIIDEESIEVAILDVNIHGERSYPLADALADRGVPFIFATGYGDSEHPERHRHVVTITKPYSMADVGAALAAT
jgi:DNA-binding response OmpR family regulator